MAKQEYEVKVQDLVLDEAVNIRMDLDEPTILRYMDSFDQLPPVEVVQVDGEYVLTDGFHRTEAAMRLGRREIGAYIRKGTIELAIEVAALANMKHGLPLQPTEMEAAVIRLRELGYSQREIAEKIGRTQPTVQVILAAMEARKNVGNVRLARNQLGTIARAPVEAQPALARAAMEQKWDEQQTRDVVAAVRKHPTALVADVIEEAVPHIKAMKDRLQYVRLFDQVVDTIRHLEAAGITPARLASSIDDPVVAARWREQSPMVLEYVNDVLSRLQLGGKNIRVVK